MTVICDLTKQAVSGLIGNGSAGGIAPVVNSIASVLSVLGAADIGIQLGTGGQAGLFDLPNLLNTAGIECVDPNTGEVTLVTPAQWYGNGMSCDGLKNPDQDRIKKEVEDFEKKLQDRNEIKNKTGIDLPLSHTKESLEKIKEKNNKIVTGFGKTGTGFVVDFDSKIIVEKESSYSVSYVGGVWGTPFMSSDEYEGSSIFEGMVRKGSVSQTKKTSNHSTSSYHDEVSDEFFTNTNSYIQIVSSIAGIGGIIGLSSATINAQSSTAGLSSRFSYQLISNVTLDAIKPKISFDPGIQSPGAYIDITPGDNNRRRDPKDPCDGGRKQPVPCQNCKLTPDLIKKINDLHRATGADRLANGTYSYYPERDIRSYGKQLYQQNPASSNGFTRPRNLIDVIAATVAAEYHRLGLQRLPAELPESLISKTNKVAKVNNTLSFHEQIFKLQDEVLGQWPIEFKVTDDGKTNDVKLWNLAEAVADLYGMQTKVVEDADLAVHWAIRAAIEASKGNNSALKVLHLLQEFVKFTGCITAPGSLTVQCTFTPDPVAKQTNEDMLKPSTQTIVVTNIVDGSSILELLKTISYASQISAKAVLQPLKPNPANGQTQMPGDYIKTERKKRKADDKAFEKWKQEKEKPISNVPPDQQPPGYKVPDIKIVQQPEENKR